jgi:hypothetical protein
MRGRPLAALWLALAPLQCCFPAIAAAQPVTAAAHPYAAHVAEAAQRFGLPERWIWAVMHAESRGNPRAVSSAGAMGLMQLMPATWAQMSALHRLGSDPFDVRANIHAGAAYLRAMLDRYGDLSTALAAYNAGPVRVDDWRTRRRPLPAETIAYVAAVVPSADGSSPTSPVLPPVVAPPDWRVATLFTTRSEAVPESDGERADDESIAVAQQDVAAPTVPSGGLFVARTRSGTRP